MTNQYYDEIIENLSPLFDEQGFAASPDAPGVYLNDKKAVRVNYAEERKMFTLDIAEIADGEGVQFSEASGWLFDEGHDSRDAKVIAEDFAETIKKSLGIVTEKSVTRESVALPTKNAKGTTPGVESFAKQFMDIFPQYKDYYRDSVAKYGEFLYEDFFRNTAAVKLRELTTKDGFNKKHITKLFTLLNTMYAEADSTVANIVMFTVLGGAFGGDVALFDSMSEYYADCPYIKQNGRAMISVIAGNKKYQDALK